MDGRQLQLFVVISLASLRPADAAVYLSGAGLRNVATLTGGALVISIAVVRIISALLAIAILSSTWLPDEAEVSRRGMATILRQRLSNGKGRRGHRRLPRAPGMLTRGMFLATILFGLTFN